MNKSEDLIKSINIYPKSNGFILIVYFNNINKEYVFNSVEDMFKEIKKLFPK